MLAGSPKVGKSWLALQLCLAVAKGEKMLGRDTLSGSALYFCLEDNWQRIQSRLYELTDEPSDKLFFSLKADVIGNGLEEQITKFKTLHDDLRLVVIDTMQMVRSETESNYGSDYAELLPLKALAEKLGISIVLVHHLRKAADNDPFNMISGSTGLSGCSDGQFVLKKDKRSLGQAVLHVTGRDIKDQELSLIRNGALWVPADEHEERKPDFFSFAIHDLMVEKEKLSVTATELSDELNVRFNLDLPSNMVSKKLMQHGVELQGYGVTFEVKRSHGKRRIDLRYERSGDGGAGNMLYPENSCPAGTRDSANPLDALFEPGDGKSEGAGSCEEYAIVNGEKKPIVRVKFEDVLKRSTNRIRQRLYEERGILVPEFKFETSAPVSPPDSEVVKTAELQSKTPHRAFVSGCGR